MATKAAFEQNIERTELASMLDIMQDVAGDKVEPGIPVGRHFLGIVVSLAESGYSLDQIVAELIAGNTAFHHTGARLNDEVTGCAMLVELSDGKRLVRPEGQQSPCRSSVEATADMLDERAARADGEDAGQTPAEARADDALAGDGVAYSGSWLAAFGISADSPGVAYIDSLPPNTDDVGILIYTDDLHATVVETIAVDATFLFASLAGVAEEEDEEGRVQLANQWRARSPESASAVMRFRR